MPLMDGIELFKWTKHKKQTPFMLMTGYSGKLENQVVFGLDADDVLIKPFSSVDLLTAVREITQRNA